MSELQPANPFQLPVRPPKQFNSKKTTLWRFPKIRFGCARSGGCFLKTTSSTIRLWLMILVAVNFSIDFCSNTVDALYVLKHANITDPKSQEEIAMVVIGGMTAWFSEALFSMPSLQDYNGLPYLILPLVYYLSYVFPSAVHPYLATVTSATSLGLSSAVFQTVNPTFRLCCQAFTSVMLLIVFHSGPIPSSSVVYVQLPLFLLRETAVVLAVRINRSTSVDRLVKLVSSDNVEFMIPRNICAMSKTLDNILKDLGLDDSQEINADAIPLRYIQADILKKVVSWCEHHLNEPTEDASNVGKAYELSEWDKEYFKVEQTTVLEIILAANFLDIAGLLNAGCKTIADMMKGKSPEQLREPFGIVHDFSLHH